MYYTFYHRTITRIFYTANDLLAYDPDLLTVQAHFLLCIVIITDFLLIYITVYSRLMLHQYVFGSMLNQYKKFIYFWILVHRRSERGCRAYFASRKIKIKQHVPTKGDRTEIMYSQYVMTYLSFFFQKYKLNRNTIVTNNENILSYFFYYYYFYAYTHLVFFCFRVNQGIII